MPQITIWKCVRFRLVVVALAFPICSLQLQWKVLITSSAVVSLGCPLQAKLEVQAGLAGSTDVAAYLRRLHNAMIAAVVDETYTSTSLHTSSWLADAASSEWESGKADLLAALGMSVGVAAAAAAPGGRGAGASGGADGPSDGHAPRALAASSLGSSQLGASRLFGAAAGPAAGRLDEYATHLAAVTNGLAKAQVAAGAAGASLAPSSSSPDDAMSRAHAPIFLYGVEAHNQHVRDPEDGSGSAAAGGVDDARRTRHWRLLMYAVGEARDQAAAGQQQQVQLPDGTAYWTRWCASASPLRGAGSTGRCGPDILSSPFLNLQDDMRLMAYPDAAVAVQWAGAGLRYLTELHAYLLPPEWSSPPHMASVRLMINALAEQPSFPVAEGIAASRRANPCRAPEGQGEGLYTQLFYLMRRGQCGQAARLARDHAVTVNGSPSLADALDVYARFLEAAIPRLDEGVVGGESIDGVLATMTQAQAAGIAACGVEFARLESDYRSGAVEVDPFHMEVVNLVSGVAGQPNPQPLVQGQEQHPIVRCVLTSHRLEWSWHRLWFATTHQLAVKAASMAPAGNGSAAGTGLRLGLLGGLGAMIGFGGGGVSSSSPSPLPAPYTPSSFASDTLDAGFESVPQVGVYDGCEQLLLAGQPERAIAHLAANGHRDSSARRRHMHDAVHMALGLARHGMLRAYPFRLAAQSSPGAAVGAPPSVVGLSEVPDSGGLLYLYQQAGVGVDAVPLYILDLPHLLTTYLQRVVMATGADGDGDDGAAAIALDYLSLLPFRAARARIMTGVLADHPSLALHLITHGLPLQASSGALSGAQLREYAEVVYAAADAARLAGRPGDAVALYRQLAPLVPRGEADLPPAAYGGDADAAVMVMRPPLLMALGIATQELSRLAPLPFTGQTHCNGGFGGGVGAGNDAMMMSTRQQLMAECRSLIDDAAHESSQQQNQMQFGQSQLFGYTGTSTSDATSSAASLAASVLALCAFFDCAASQQWGAALEAIRGAGLLPSLVTGGGAAGYGSNLQDEWVSVETRCPFTSSVSDLARRDCQSHPFPPHTHNCAFPVLASLGNTTLQRAIFDTKPQYLQSVYTHILQAAAVCIQRLYQVARQQQVPTAYPSFATATAEAGDVAFCRSGMAALITGHTQTMRRMIDSNVVTDIAAAEAAIRM